MAYPRAFLAGAFAGIVMSLLMVATRLAGVAVTLEMMMGTMVFDAGPVAWVAGFVMHVVLSGLIGIAYLWVFESVTKRGGVARGMAVSVPHLVIAGVAMGAVVPAVHRLIPESVAGPGYFLASQGLAGIVAFVLLHLVFGAIVGAMCAEHVRRPRLTASLG